MRVILVPVADRPECEVALDTAFGLAARLGGSVVGCHVRPHRPESAAALSGLMPADFPADAKRAGRARLDSRAARQLYDRRAEAHGFTRAKKARLGQSSLALWHEMVGTPARILGIVGPLSDLAIVSRPKPKGSGPARAFLLATLLHTARPVLVLPQSGARRIGRRILIAWNQSSEAARTVAAALPLLQAAEQVAILSCGPENSPGPKSSHLAEYLLHWSVKSERLATRGRDVGAEVESAFRDLRADLLLMGAYSRPRLRELVFGGLTERMLMKSALPVLMLHS